MELKTIEKVDPEVTASIKRELGRQRNTIELIASENFVSPAVMAAMGTVPTNKYAEGYPGKRYYGGCRFVDEIEDLARERLKKLFNAEHANVQPHSGAQANIAVYFALLKPGDTVMGMNLSHGGHLTHGSPVNISGKYFNFVPYGVSPATGRIDYDEMARVADQARPKLIVAGASAYPREIDFKRIKEIADSVDAYLMVDMAHIAGLVATGYHMSPVPYADVVTTTTHKTLRGPRGGSILCKEELGKKIDKAIFPGTQGGPLMHIIAAKAVCFKEALSDDFKIYQGRIIENAQALADGLLKRDIDLVSGGTDNHLMLVDLRKNDVSGKDIEKKLEEINITVNKNTIPDDPKGPNTTSGIRLGTPATTTRGFGTGEMDEIADIIATVIKGNYNIDEIKNRVAGITSRFPLYEGE